MTNNEQHLEPAAVKEMFSYDWETGLLYRRFSAGDRKALSATGSLTPKGYLRVWINGRRYMIHRLVWAYHRGTWPKNQIDHINGIPHDNRIENLREVSARENNQNYSRHRKGMLVGATYSHNQKNPWKAKVQIGNRQLHLGYFATEKDAHRAYRQALESA